MTDFNFQSTCIGSFPHLDGGAISEKLLDALDIPAWPQLPKRDYRESMYVQYSRVLPRLVQDTELGKVTFNTEGDLSDDLAAFYELYLADDPDLFALTPDYAAGFFAMLETLAGTPGEWAKGHVTGPVSFGLSVVDQRLQPSLYHPDIIDCVTRNMAMNARWQIKALKAHRPNVIIFVDEPYMAQFGSAFISLSREQALGMLDEVFGAIQADGGLAGVHCCANTDWSVLLDSQVDILNLDAYEYVENLALYPEELRRFIDRGGKLAWGIVPTSEVVFETTPEQMAAHWEAGVQTIIEKSERRGVAFSRADFIGNCLITPSCGLGTASTALAERAITLLSESAQLLQSS